MWRAVLVDRTSLGGAPSPERVEGHVCPKCTEAIDEVGGVGWRARARAVLAHVSLLSAEEARNLRSRVEGDFPPTLLAWGARPVLRPNGSPWEHLVNQLSSGASPN